MFTSTILAWQLLPYRKKHSIDNHGTSMSIPKTTEIMGLVVFMSVHVNTY